MFGHPLLVCAALTLTACRRDPLPQFPRVMLWAWESPQNLDFIDPKQAGVAFLARTVLLKDGEAKVLPRFQSLHVPSGTDLMAVVRIESQGASLPSANAVCELASQPAALAGVRGLQIDFDAK